MEKRIWLISDLHLFHDREFLYKPRGFNNIESMNWYIFKKWNDCVDWDDEVYVLGDLVLNNLDEGIFLLSRLKGHLHIIRGNHDTDTKMNLYKNLWNVVEVCDACYIKYKKYYFFCTHYPCITCGSEINSLKQCTCNLFGHTHSKNKFYNNMPNMYNVACDAHDCTPVLLDDIIIEMNKNLVDILNKRKDNLIDEKDN